MVPQVGAVGLDESADVGEDVAGGPRVEAASVAQTQGNVVVGAKEAADDSLVGDQASLPDASAQTAAFWADDLGA
ncbi:hypothetical protein MXD62_13210 [Frankia sp. Mgl5]|nr:hypothetical protein [Frankia sp. Mgl5]MCK9928120.1 hypothetical protein [Frankia sp. Mgl5]